jgi:ubiquinone/menaquinone biosynthesis C-methylase UbiE
MPSAIMEQGQVYWEDRAARGQDHDGFEWFTIGFEQLESILRRLQVLQSSTTSVLEVGCGTSGLMLHLVQARNNSTKNLHAIDYSPTCIQRQEHLLAQQLQRQEHHQGNSCSSGTPYLFQVMDATKMTFDNSTFDVLVDKGALDSMDMVGTEEEDDDEATNMKTSRCARDCVLEYARVLKPGGHALIVSCRSPLERRLMSLEAAKVPFALESCQLYKAPGQEDAPGGFGIFVLQRLPDHNCPFELHDEHCQQLLKEAEAAYLQSLPNRENDSSSSSSNYITSSYDKDQNSLLEKESGTIWGALSAELESY